MPGPKLRFWRKTGVFFLFCSVFTFPTLAATDETVEKNLETADTQPSGIVVDAEALCLLKPEHGYQGDPTKMMSRYFLADIDAKKEKRRKVFEETLAAGVEKAREYQHYRVERFLESIGPFPEKTPLNPQITKIHDKGDFRAETIILETRPGFFLTGILFLPPAEPWKAPYPAVLVACGHSDVSKGYDVYQKGCILAARNGIAAFIVDPFDQGERHQLLREDGKPFSVTVHAHNYCQANSIPLGLSAANYMIWDLIRSVDYLQSREDIDPERIGAAGQSGGGTQSAYLMALDSRIAVAAPSCYLCSLYGKLPRTIGPQDGEQNIFGQLDFGMDHADYLNMRAPKPTLICAATEDFFPIEDTWAAFREAKRFYNVFGRSECVAMIEGAGKHGWSQPLREAMVRWMTRWFYDNNVVIEEPADMAVLKPEEALCTAEGEVLKLDGARSVYDLNREYDEQLVTERERLWADGLTEELCERIRRKIVARNPGELSQPKLRVLGEPVPVSLDGKPFAVVLRGIYTSEPGIDLPMLQWSPVPGGAAEKSEKAGKTVIFLHDSGKLGILENEAGRAFLREQLESGNRVVTLDLRGQGETQFVGGTYFNPEHFGTDGNDFFLAYLLGKTYVGMRCEDLWNLVRLMCDDSQDEGSQESVELHARGFSGIVALHAAVLEPGLFSKVAVRDDLSSWSAFVHAGAAQKVPLTALVHDALTVYDLPDLSKTLENQGIMEKAVPEE